MIQDIIILGHKKLPTSQYVIFWTFFVRRFFFLALYVFIKSFFSSLLTGISSLFWFCFWKNLCMFFHRPTDFKLRRVFLYEFKKGTCAADAASCIISSALRKPLIDKSTVRYWCHKFRDGYKSLQILPSDRPTKKLEDEDFELGGGQWWNVDAKLGKTFTFHAEQFPSNWLQWEK